MTILAFFVVCLEGLELSSLFITIHVGTYPGSNNRLRYPTVDCQVRTYAREILGD